MKADLREIYGAPTRAAAEAAIADKYNAKHDKAVACLTKNREALPAEHWDHLRTSDEIDKFFFCLAICCFGSARVTAWQRAGPEDVSPTAQPLSSLLTDGTRSPFFRTTWLPSADELLTGMFSVTRDVDLPTAQFLDQDISQAHSREPRCRLCAAWSNRPKQSI